MIYYILFVICLDFIYFSKNIIPSRKTADMNTEFLKDINWVAVLVAGLAYFAIGAIWYSKLLFSKNWIEYTGVDVNDPKAKEGMLQYMLFSLVLMIVCSAGLAILISKLELSGWKNGVKLGGLTGLCFGATALSITYLFEKKPLGLHLINGLYVVIGSIVAAVILCVWQ